MYYVYYRYLIAEVIVMFHRTEMSLKYIISYFTLLVNYKIRNGVLSLVQHLTEQAVLP